jgi:hypothetical protein
MVNIAMQRQQFKQTKAATQSDEFTEDQETMAEI